MTSLPSRRERFAPDERLPLYTYVPGRAPHPLRDPAGHSFGNPVEAVESIDEANWSTHRRYLYAVDLFNLGYYWEAHEAWEAVWHACGRRGTTADLLKALIKLAAAGVKLREGRPTGVVRHLQAATALLAQTWAAPSAPRLGLNLEQLQADVAARLERPPPCDAAPPTEVRPLFGFTLLHARS